MSKVFKGEIVRELKFRAKPLDFKKHPYTSRLLEFSFADVNNWFEEDNIFYIDGVPCFIDSIQQYTGRKDKNGEEIWEGDILSDGSGFLATVVWYQGKSMFGIKATKEMEPATLYPAQMLKCEVLGNIMENPELLK